LYFPKEHEESEESTYLCGNSLGLQPRRLSEYVTSHLNLWSSKGVYGHFKDIEDSPIPPWVHIDEAATSQSAVIVGAQRSEVAIMESLTANLHFLLCSFYRPTSTRYKIILEGKAFPSDHYVVESQIALHDLDPASAMVLINPPSKDSPLLPTDHILSIIDAHADSCAVLLLPGVQFYTGQFFDMPKINAHAQSKGILVGWDLAHAVGNVPMQLHDWNVDFAAWCNYKYMNCGPGAIGGLFVHERHSGVDKPSPTTHATNGDGKTPAHRPRLSGWWGSDKNSRFAMTNTFAPIPGAAGFQLSNPSAIDLSAVLASLSVFEKTDMAALRRKSLAATAYLEDLLLADSDRVYSIITPSDKEQRGAQLSILLEEGLLETVMEYLEEEGVVVDERKPDVIRVAPAPLYNSYEDIWNFMQGFREGCKRAVKVKNEGKEKGKSVMVDGGSDDKGWSDIK